MRTITEKTLDGFDHAGPNLYALLTIELQKHLRGTGFPNCDRGRTLLSIADFSGAHRSARFSTYAFMTVDLDRIGWWLDGQRRFRREILRNGRRLSFKALNDRERQRALPSFLRAADAMDGALIVIAIPKKAGSVFRPSQRAGDEELLLKPWKRSVHEHLLRITHFAALSLSLTTKPGQNVFWISDQDEIASNERQLRALTALFARILGNALPHDLGHIRVGTTWSDNGSLALEDLAAITDLAAGSTCEAVSAMVKQGTFPVPGVITRLPIGLTNKAEFLLQWLAMTDRPLRKFIVIIDELHTARPRLTKLGMRLIPNLIQPPSRSAVS